MKNALISTLIIGAALSLGACNKDKKPATTDPSTPAAGSAGDPAAANGSGGAAMAPAPAGDTKPASGGW